MTLDHAETSVEGERWRKIRKEKEDDESQEEGRKG